MILSSFLSLHWNMFKGKGISDKFYLFIFHALWVLGINPPNCITAHSNAEFSLMWAHSGFFPRGGNYLWKYPRTHFYSLVCQAKITGWVDDGDDEDSNMIIIAATFTYSTFALAFLSCVWY